MWGVGQVGGEHWYLEEVEVWVGDVDQWFQ